jgi:hypothetical protein
MTPSRLFCVYTNVSEELLLHLQGSARRDKMETESFSEIVFLRDSEYGVISRQTSLFICSVKRSSEVETTVLFLVLILTDYGDVKVNDRLK